MASSWFHWAGRAYAVAAAATFVLHCIRSRGSTLNFTFKERRFNVKYFVFLINAALWPINAAALILIRRRGLTALANDARSAGVTVKVPFGSIMDDTPKRPPVRDFLALVRERARGRANGSWSDSFDGSTEIELRRLESEMTDDELRRVREATTIIEGEEKDLA